MVTTIMIMGIDVVSVIPVTALSMIRAVFSVGVEVQESLPLNSSLRY